MSEMLCNTAAEIFQVGDQSGALSSGLRPLVYMSNCYVSETPSW